MTDWGQLLERAKWGTLSRAEIDMAARELEKPEPDADRYTLIHILGKARAYSYRHLIERFLESPEDPMLARIALQSVCDFWGRVDQYIEKVHEFVRGVPWDENAEVRQIAISIAGEYLHSQRRPKLLEDLLRIFENKAEPESVRQDAYMALARAMGRDWQYLASLALHRFDFGRDVDPKVIEDAKRRLAE